MEAAQSTAAPTIAPTIADAIKRHLSETQLLGPSIGVTQPLFESGLIDSAGFVTLVTFLETHFGIAIEGEDLVPENFDTIDRMVQLVESKRVA